MLRGTLFTENESSWLTNAVFFFSQIWPKKSPKKSRRAAPDFFLDFFLDKNFGSEGKRDFGLFFGQKTEKNGPEGPVFRMGAIGRSFGLTGGLPVRLRERPIPRT